MIQDLAIVLEKSGNLVSLLMLSVSRKHLILIICAYSCKEVTVTHVESLLLSTNGTRLRMLLCITSRLGAKPYSSLVTLVSLIIGSA